MALIDQLTPTAALHPQPSMELGSRHDLIQLNGVQQPIDDGEDSAQSDYEDEPPPTKFYNSSSNPDLQHALEIHHTKTRLPTPDARDESSAQDLYILQNNKIIDRAREYQQELFERAKDENIIAVLDTGMGKTLIAAMLIRHVLEQDLLDTTGRRKPKSVFFLANSIPLVNQQARVLANNLATTVGALHGDGNHDLWQRSEWEQILVEKRVIVCTPAVLHNALSHGYIRMQDISLLIFDEAHHCKKNHPYSIIVRDYFLKIRDFRPRLFSMTASPVESKKDIKKTVDDLEELLHSKVVTTTDASVLEFAHKPVDKVWTYEKPLSPVYTDLYQRLAPTKTLIPELDVVFKSALDTSHTLGTWFADRILSYALAASKHQSTNILSKFEMGSVFAGMQSLEDRTSAMDQLKELADLARQHHHIPISIQAPSMSSKVQVLYDNLRTQYTAYSETKAMVFVQQRTTAVLLCDGIRDLNLPHVRAAYLTGGGQSGHQIITGKKQEETMRHFHAGLINLLFTTSVGEEGIDVPQCNLIVRFDLYTTTIQYMQSRGRARMKDSVYAHMVEDGNVKQMAMMDYAIESADYLKLYCHSLPADRLLGKGTKLQQLIAKDSANQSFRTASGAICNYSNCLVILSRYASSLHHTGAMTTEFYEERILDESDAMFQYVVRLPTNSQSQIKGAIGEPRQNKALAKRSAAFKCVGKLRGAKLLDDNMNSIFHAFKPENANARLALSGKQDNYEMKVKPDIWRDMLGEVPTHLYGALLEIKPITPLTHQLAPLLLLTRVRLPTLPSFPMYVKAGIEAHITFTQSSSKLKVDEVNLQLLTGYTLNAVFEDVFNKAYAPDSTALGYWLAPVRTAGQNEDLERTIDFDVLQSASRSRVKWSPGMSASEWCNKFLVDPLDGKYHYFSDNVVEGVNAFDPEPSEFLPKQGKKSKPQPIIYFTDSHWNVKQKDNFAQQWDRSQPVMNAELQTVRRNFLDRPTEQELARHRCWIAPEPLEVGRITPAAARTVLMWPSIIHRLESYLIVLEAFVKMGLEGISPDLALEAFTKDDNTDDQAEQVHSGRCRGMGKNYERLEFIGDSLLKMTTTMSVFNRTTCDEEGMHCRRMELLCNRRLFTVATTSLGLEKYIRSQGFNRDTWYPENLVLLAGRGAKGEPVSHGSRTHSLGMKTIADVCEATIGAAVTATKHLPIPERFDLGIKAISRLVESEDHDLSSWGDFAGTYIAPDWQLRMDDPIANNLAGEVSKRVGYQFRYPRLIRSAFTHSSDTTAPVPDLQRLEFLGDAVLDWVCIWWLFDSNPDKNPQWLTEHKMAMVSNKFLAALAVKLDFDKLFAVKSSKLAAAIFTYAAKVRAELETAEYEKDFWTRVEVDKVPKALSDLVESTLGALLIDSGFDYKPIEDFFNRHVKPFFDDISLYDGFASMQPTSFFHKKLTGEYGCSSFKMQWDERHDGSEALDVETLAGVLVHGNPVSSATGKSPRYAKVRASQKAIAALDGMTRAEFRRRFGCDCKKGAEMEEAEAAAMLHGPEVDILVEEA